MTAADRHRTLAGTELAAALRESRARALAFTHDLSEAQWQAVPAMRGLNPVAWELAHVAWFAEFWVLRGPHRRDGQGLVHAARPPRRIGPDVMFDSARLPHARRWTAPLPDRGRLAPMMAGQLEDVLVALPTGGGDADLYFHRLALLHEDMHGEAFAWMRARLGWPAPAGLALAPRGERRPITCAGGMVTIGRGTGTPGFSFDNEQPAAEQWLAPFEIDSAPVSAGEVLAFVEDGGYWRSEFWPGDAQAWHAALRPAHPERWRKQQAGWEMRWFDRWLPLDPAMPAIQLNAFEAEAYCHWAGRRLPCAAEWEVAAAHPGFRWGGSVWEPTADAFTPYFGFAPGPYADYSAPWFGNHRELRGGAFATHARLHDRRYRNFFTPDRCDVFSGFRTAAVQS